MSKKSLFITLPRQKQNVNLVKLHPDNGYATFHLTINYSTLVKNEKNSQKAMFGIKRAVGNDVYFSL